ncbi:MAG: contractile injection system tape measure protein [Novosphingobium sp.]
MGAARHLVARQTFEIIATDRALAEAMAGRTSAASGTLARAVERTLDDLDIADVHLRFDRVEIDLGPCDPARWEEALARGIVEGLGARIVAVAERQGAATDPAESALALLTAFARTGRLPWWAAGGDTPAQAVAVLAERQVPPAAIRTLLAMPNAGERLIVQLGERELGVLIHLARPAFSPEAIVALANELAAPESAVPAVNDRSTRRAIWHAVLAEALTTDPVPLSAGDVGEDADEPSTPAWAAFRAAIIARLPSGRLEQASARPSQQPDRQTPPGGLAPSAEAAVPASALASHLRALARGSHPDAALLEQLAARAATLDPRSAAAVLTAMRVGNSTVPALLAAFVAHGGLTSSEAAGWRGTLFATDDDPHDAIAVGNAGLVLLWPFLDALLAGCGWVVDGGFRNIAVQQRAAALLGYLADGDPAPLEHALPLAKVLTGIDINALLVPGEPLSEFERASADAMLAAVLGHAPMLGKISICGLRQAFLARPGALATRDGHWLLRVERRSIDILIERLPWSFGWVRLPWMAAPVQVEW